MVQTSLVIDNAFENRENTTTSLSWIHLEVKEGTGNGLGSLDDERRFAYSPWALNRDKIQEFWRTFDQKMDVKFDIFAYQPRALNFN